MTSLFTDIIDQKTKNRTASQFHHSFYIHQAMTSGRPGYNQGVQMVPGEAILNDV